MDIWSYSNFQDAWSNVLKNWFIEKTYEASPQGKHLLVIAPYESANHFLKLKLNDQRVSYDRIQFLTPDTLRTFVTSLYFNEKKELLSDEDFSLLIRIACDHLPHNPFAQAIKSSPMGLVEAYNQLGVNKELLAVLFAGQAFELIKAVNDLLHQSQLKRREFIDLEIAQMIRGNVQSNHFNTLAFGFGISDWNNYLLLQTFCSFSETATICLLDVHGGFIEEAWKGSWEEHSQKEIEVLDSKEMSTMPFSGLVDAFEIPLVGVENQLTHKKTEAIPEFIIAQDSLQEAQSIVAHILDFMSCNPSKRIGIIVSGKSSILYKELTELFRVYSISYYDYVDAYDTSKKDIGLLNAFLKWQKEVALDSFINFIELCALSGLIDSKIWLHFKKHACSTQLYTLSNHFEIFSAYCKLGSDKKDWNVFLDDWLLLPDTGSLKQYIALIDPMLVQLGFGELTEILLLKADGLLGNLEYSLTKDTFLAWIYETILEGCKQIQDYSDSASPMVSILTIQEAVLQEWDLLISTTETVDASNKIVYSIVQSEESIKKYNQEALKQGKYGEGHICIHSLKTWVLSKADQQLVVMKQLLRLIENTKISLVFTHSLSTQTAENLNISASESNFGVIFSHAFLATHGSLPENIVWNESFNLHSKVVPEVNGYFDYINVQQSEIAYQSRRNPDELFGEYQFCLKFPFSERIAFSAKQWEKVFQKPESVWFRDLLGIYDYATKDTKVSSALAVGTWVHEWVLLPKCSDRLNVYHLDEWLTESLERATVLKKHIQATYAASKMVVPDYWNSLWNKAKQITKKIIYNLSLESCEAVAGEITIPEESEFIWGVTAEESFLLKGRIDLIITAVSQVDTEIFGKKEKVPVTILDIKTQGNHTLKINQLKAGKGLQLLFYGLALINCGYDPVTIQFINPDKLTLKDEFIIDSTTIEALTPIFKYISTYYNQGILGQKHNPRDAYKGDIRFPLATLKISENILQQKNNQTFVSVVN
jgi:hypothetical protein